MLRLAKNGPIKTLSTPRRIRIFFAGACLADTLGTSGALYVWEHEYYPQLYIPDDAFIEPPGYDVVTSERGALVDEQGRKIATRLGIEVRPTGTSYHKFVSIDDGVVHFAQDMEGPAEALTDYIKVNFDAVGEYHGRFGLSDCHD